jgi:GTPase SAR1 family protein
MNEPTFFQSYGVLITAGATIIGAVVGAIVKYLLDITIITEKDKKILELDTARKSLTGNVSSLQTSLAQKDAQITAIEKEHKYQISKIAEKLQHMKLIYSHNQPVLLCGPRKVGKTSLAKRLYSPWERVEIAPTRIISKCEVPVINLDCDEFVEHPAMRINVRQEKAVSLHIYDVPGELKLQEDIIHTLTNKMEKSYGVVMIFMFDASELDGITPETREYYNGDLFQQLRSLQASRINIVRIILVFNKFDILQEKYRNDSVNDLIRKCSDKFSRLLDPIHDAVNPEKICEVASILESTNKNNINMGDSLIKGEASREIIRKIDKNQISAVIKEDATNYSAKYFYQQ